MTKNLRNILHPVTLKSLVKEWLREDTPSFDYGGYVVGETVEEAVILCKSPGVFAGAPFVEAIFKELDCTVYWFVNEGDFIDPHPTCQVGRVVGKASCLLLGERPALNCIARSSGVASVARRLTQLTKAHGWQGEIAGTRKTTPGFRLVEKYSLLVGGVSTHRYDLSSMIMLKDNHIWTAGSITQAVKDARRVGGFSCKIEVECRSLDEACQAIQAGCDVVMLDNFSPEALHACAASLKTRFPHVLVEASGGVTETSLPQYLGPNIDVISLSITTQGYETVDFSLKIQKHGHDPANPTVE